MNRMTKAEIADIEIKIIGGNAQVVRRMVADDGNGLIFEVTARNNLRFYFQHPEFGESNDVQLAVEGNKEYYLDAWLNQLYNIIVASNTADADVYIDNSFKGRTDENFVLSIKDVLPGEHTIRIEYGGQSQEQTINVNSGSSLYYKQNVNISAGAPQYVVLQVEPSNAVIVIDSKPYTPDNGVVATMLSSGSHTYRASATGFYDESGTISISGKKIEKQIKLKPSFGWIEMIGDEFKGALVYVDNEYTATAPFKRKSITKGSHNIQIIKELYKPYNSTIEVTENEVILLQPQLQPDYADVQLSAENRAEIWVDGKSVGRGKWAGRLQSGEHIAEVRLANHRTSIITLQITAGESQTIQLETPKPIYGSINITSSPAMAEVSLDGTVIGRTPILYDEVIIGRHMLRITKSGYADYSDDIVVEEGKTTNIEASLLSGLGNAAVSHTQTSNAPSQNNSSLPKIEMVFVEGGSFIMVDENQAQKEVTLPGYYIGTFEITQTQWRAVMGTTIIEQRDKHNPNGTITGEGDDYPIYYVSCEEAEEFCRRLSEQSGLKYRLPTSAEWEYAAKGGNNSRNKLFSGDDKAVNVGWVKENALKTSHPVGQKQPNELAIFDMTGNVAEWCKDTPKAQYNLRSTTIDAKSQIKQSIRGGSWAMPAKECKITSHNKNQVLPQNNCIGFRVAMNDSKVR